MSVTERRIAERRHDMTDNPEVMGRNEPRFTEPARSDMWPDMTEFQTRFEKIQSDFIDDPKAAVRNAERLMQEVIDRVTSAMQERMRSVHRDNDDKADTEQLRGTMRTYREFIRSLGDRHAA